jgi:hypothetical protein
LVSTASDRPLANGTGCSFCVSCALVQLVGYPMDIKNGLEARSQTVHQEEDMHEVHKLNRGKEPYELVIIIARYYQLRNVTDCRRQLFS